jgi:hypothetical protein
MNCRALSRYTSWLRPVREDEEDEEEEEDDKFECEVEDGRSESDPLRFDRRSLMVSRAMRRHSDKRRMMGR